MWKEAVVFSFDFITKSFCVVTEGYHLETSQNFYVSHLNIALIVSQGLGFLGGFFL